MITAQQAARQLKKIHPERTITMCLDYDNKHYIFEALIDPKKTDYDAPFYAVDKSSGKVTCFSPAEDLDKFFDALDNGQINFD